MIQPLRSLGFRVRHLDRSAAIDGLAAGLFWSWNLVFLAFMVLGFAPSLLPQLLSAFASGELPAAFLITGLVLAAIPVLILALALWLPRLRAQPRRLFALGYGVEAPLMLLVGLRFFAVRQMTPAMALLLGMAGLGVLSYLWQLLDTRPGERGPLLEHLRVVGLTLLLAAGLYAAVWIAFYALPLAAGMVDLAAELLHTIRFEWREILSAWWQALRDFRWRDLLDIQWLALPLAILGVPLAAYTASLLVGMPLAVSLLYLRAWWQGMCLLAARYARWRPAALAAGTLALLALAFVGATRQPQQRAFALLEAPPTTPAEARALLAESDAIRAGLLNAYLARERYFSARGEVRHVADLYRNGPLALAPERAERITALYERLASPLLYQPVEDHADSGLPDWQNAAFVEEPGLAAERYAAFFDAPIDRAERPEIVRAVQSTWNIDQATTARLAVDDREVWLESQAIEVVEHGDWAEIELHEAYRNRTFERQELIYWFSLPESAVLTGLWLGESADREARSAFRVAPRGAAQQLYREEVQRRVDPALLEQIGPRQYRLRVFPIEPRRIAWNGETQRSFEADPTPMHLWLRYAVLAEADPAGGAVWPLPRLADHRNVYWDSETVFDQSGVRIFRDASSDWLPAALPASAMTRPTSHRIDLADGRSVLARPADANDLAASAGPLRLALVIDSSRSMAVHREALAAAVDAARARVADQGGSLELYQATSAYSGQAPRRLDPAGFDPAGLLYFGGQNPAELLLQYDALAEGRQHDAVLVLTDGSGFELGASERAVPIPAAPLWLVHLDGQIPLGYDDGTLAAIQASGGGMAGSLAAALSRIDFARRAGSEGGVPGTLARDLIDGYVWSVVPTAELAGSVDRLPEPALPSRPEPAPLPTAISAPEDGAPEDPGVGAGGLPQPADEAGFDTLAARFLILAETRAARGRLDRIEALDALQAIAAEQGIVTPYSSMIVLVNTRQHERLDALSKDPDRFERELEAAGQTTESPLAVTGVPEPEEWLLLLLAAGLLLWQVRSPLRRPVPRRVA
ncbi:MAG: TIGR02921 family PEP-CTERM protein [Chloroflexi bacterium]|nr:TIGR02921 family PEP-CTERM protein [Chloroflexota bacterium]